MTEEQTSVAVVWSPHVRAQCPSFLYWVGGKSAFTPLVMPCVHRRLLATGGTYVDPFLGGGAFPLDLGLGTRAEPRMRLSDINRPLVITYLAVRDRWQAIADALATLAEDTSEARFLAIRDAYNAILRPLRELPQPRSWLEDDELAIYFLYLNALAHSGLYRVNKSGDFNAPYGHNCILSAFKRMALGEALSAASAALQGATLAVADFES